MRRKIPLLLTALAVSLTFSCASDAPDEMLPYFPALAEIPDYDTSKTPGENGGAVLVPAMKKYEYTYKGYMTLSDILENYPRKQSV